LAERWVHCARRCRYRVVGDYLCGGRFILLGHDVEDDQSAEFGLISDGQRATGDVWRVRYKLMQIISFKDTVLYKRGFWLGAAALVAAVSAPSVIDKSIFTQPVIYITPIFILIGFWVYFMQRGRLFSMADEVVDGGDQLEIRRGRTEVIAPFFSIASVEVNSQYRIHRVTIYLREETKLGKRIDFWPLARTCGDLFAAQLVAGDRS
jgi:hypothetical protein